MPRPMRSISLPIILSSVTVGLAAAMLVAWIYVILKHLELTKQYVQNTWLLVTGIVSLVIIIAVLVLFSVFLAREILENRRHTSFIDSVTHELRSPLASMRLCLETLARPELGESQRQNLREMALEDVERLSSFIDDILEANRLGHGDPAHEASEVVLARVVDVCVAAVCRRHHVAAEDFSVQVPQGIVLTTDPTALEIIIKNLLDNAVKYSDRPLAIVVEASQDHSHVALHVRDTGVGIDRRDLKRIFQRFYRSAEENVRARRGTGLGLYVVYALVKTLGGSAWATSAGTGRGATMHVRLPSVPQRRFQPMFRRPIVHRNSRVA